MFNIQWCAVCRRVTSWHMVGSTHSVLTCDECRQPDKRDMERADAAFMKTVVEVDRLLTLSKANDLQGVTQDMIDEDDALNGRPDAPRPQGTLHAPKL